MMVSTYVKVDTYDRPSDRCRAGPGAGPQARWAQHLRPPREAGVGAALSATGRVGGGDGACARTQRQPGAQVDHDGVWPPLDVANGTVLTQCKPKHRYQEFLAFLKHIEANAPEHLDVHLICDNCGTHKHAGVKAWLARRPRFHLHFTSTYSS